MKKLLAMFLAVMILISGTALAEGTWVCPNCGRENSENFCPKDGTAKPETTWTCPACGRENSDEDNFCGKDGTPKPETIKNALPTVGASVTFGSYEQDGNAENGKEAIEWLVLDVDDKANTALLISKYAQEAKPYNVKYADVTWETCTLRKWLNEEFYNTAFTAEEQAQIVTAKVTAEKNPDHSIDPGKDTEDKVWLLSITEANRYFANDEARMCYPTKHAESSGAYTYNGSACWWWLRSPGQSADSAADVGEIGNVRTKGDYVAYGDECVRPVVVLRLS